MAEKLDEKEVVNTRLPKGLIKNMKLACVQEEITITDRKTGEVISSLNIPTLHQVNYDTTLGDDMIVFDSHGTSEYNKRVHGGDLMLKSCLSFRKNIAVNCTGLVTEGLYPGG